MPSTGTNRQSTSSSALLKHYHWLPIHQRIQFKIACVTYKTIHTTQPVYLNSVLEHYTPARTLRSSDTNLLSVPRVRTCFGSRSFSVAAPTIWNSVPFDIRNSCSMASFRRKLKTFFFQCLAMSSAPSLLYPSASDSASLSQTLRALQIKFTYLLTYIWTSTDDDIWLLLMMIWWFYPRYDIADDVLLPPFLSTTCVDMTSLCS